VRSFAQRVWDDLRAALDNDLLTNDEMRAIIKILRPVADRAKHGGPARRRSNGTNTPA